MSDPSRQTIVAAIERALGEALPELNEADWSQTLSGDMGLDSVQIMNLVMEIEDQLDVSIPVELLAEVQTLDELADRLVALEDSR